VVDERVHEEAGQIALAAAGALIAAIVAAFLLSGRLVRPFRRLAVAAAGGALDLPPQRVREVEAIAAALRSSQVHQEALLKSERDFARNVSHQLRTPLTGMRLSVEGLLLDDHDERTREDLESVLREIDRLSDTVTALLAFARRGDLGTSRQVTVSEVLAGAVQRWSRLAEEEGRSLVFQPPSQDRLAQVPVVVVDQVLDVLVHNALTHGSGTVRLSGELTGSSIVLRVSDDGVLGDVPDSQLLGRSGSTATGEGIGLALSASLAHVTGGGLRVVGREPTCFELRLPLS
jgi:signal transduction histidine kinase